MRSKLIFLGLILFAIQISAEEKAPSSKGYYYGCRWSVGECSASCNGFPTYVEPCEASKKVSPLDVYACYCRIGKKQKSLQDF